MIRIDFLGTGNAFAPPGRLHSLVLIDKKILIDSPPTLISQLRRGGIGTSDIEHLLFTHWHADHTFGFPFLLLERKFITDPELKKKLNIYLRPGGKKILSELCNVGFPGSLEDTVTIANWFEEENRNLIDTDWEFERFPVCHTPETDPHGYELRHSSGLILLHCGDSGPCQEIEKRAEKADIVILEMGMPDIGNFPYHFTPNDVRSFSKKFPNTFVLVTHNFSNSVNSNGGFPLPNLPNEVYQLEDGDVLEISHDKDFKISNNDASIQK